MSNFMKIRPVGAELFYPDRRTDGLDEANSRFSQLRESSLNKGKKRHVQNNTALYELPDTSQVSMTNCETVN
jgi:hypothetical protein